ncbi:hypothetical protein B0H16DRAFT_1337606, partial [Mycena metata]
TGGALASAATQGGMDALEELRLLKDQVRDVSRICNAVATGDLTQKITVPVQGDLMVQLKKVINTMVDNLGHFATKVTRVSRDVGTEVRRVSLTPFIPLIPLPSPPLPFLPPSCRLLPSLSLHFPFAPTLTLLKTMDC